jgi:hypothetical protein
MRPQPMTPTGMGDWDEDADMGEWSRRVEGRSSLLRSRDATRRGLSEIEDRDPWGRGYRDFLFFRVCPRW